MSVDQGTYEPREHPSREQVKALAAEANLTPINVSSVIDRLASSGVIEEIHETHEEYGSTIWVTPRLPQSMTEDQIDNMGGTEWELEFDAKGKLDGAPIDFYAWWISPEKLFEVRGIRYSEDDS